MKKYIYGCLGILLTTLGSMQAQNDLSFYHMGDYVSQTQNLSPVHLPKNAFTLGVLAHAGASANSNLLLSDVFVANGNRLKIDFDNLHTVAQKKNNISAGFTIPLWMLSLKTKKGSLSLFANVKGAVNWLFTDDFTSIAANGFAESFALSNEKLLATSYSEIAIGYTHKFLNDRLVLALRLKSLNGLSHAQTQENASFSIDVAPITSFWNVKASNAAILTSGLEIEDGEMKLFTDNNGFGMDLGATYAATKKLTLEIAVNDIGSIQWKENVRNYKLDDSDGKIYQGTDLNTEGSIEEEIEDALNEVIGSSETTESFTTKLATRTFLSARYQLTQKNTLVAAFFNNSHALIESKPSYSIGYQRTLNKTTFGILARSGGAQNSFSFGANAMLRLGFLQFYAATDNLASLFGKVEEVHGGSIRFGLNIVYGYKS
jgi:hypothetical protein